MRPWGVNMCIWLLRAALLCESTLRLITPTHHQKSSAQVTRLERLGPSNLPNPNARVPGFNLQTLTRFRGCEVTGSRFCWFIGCMCL
ncbi:hypothetical protein DL93DRAFT_1290398 [Clavulina sp. PMI_390]|nr:hypothetical protein DL93DRAFT_1290398 [Clavulina sp. PMI_390]